MPTPLFEGMPLEILFRIALGTIDCHTALVSLPLVSKQAYIASIANLYTKVSENALATLAQPSSASQQIMRCRHPAYYVEHIDISADIANETFLSYFVDAFNNVSRYAKKKTSFTFGAFYLFDLNPVSTTTKLEYSHFESVSLCCSRPPVFGVDLFSALMTSFSSERLKHLILDFHMVSVPVNFPTAVKALLHIQPCCSTLQTLHLTYDALHQGSSASVQDLFNLTSFLFPHLEDFYVSDCHGDLDISNFLVRHPKIKRLGYIPGCTVDVSSFLKDRHVVPELESLSGCGFVITTIVAYAARPLTSITITDWSPDAINVMRLREGLARTPTLREFSLLLDDWFTAQHLRQFQSVFNNLRLFECNLLINTISPDEMAIYSFYQVCTDISPSLSLLTVHTFCLKTDLLLNLHRHAIETAWTGRSLSTALHITVLCRRAKDVLVQVYLPASSALGMHTNT
ncbi:hypothetical protein F5879DRAFT_994950 [Lentinula edodes]|nr:hypothetical protein F5879DRAFT_994950 [Lentinula edodes]